jgi:hypothetical protein
MGRGLVISKDGQEWTFTDAEAEKISNCSEFIQSLIEQEMEINEDSEDDITISIDSPYFTSLEVGKAIDYLKHHEFKPPLYGKVSIYILNTYLCSVLVYEDKEINKLWNSMCHMYSSIDKLVLKS